MTEYQKILIPTKHNNDSNDIFSFAASQSHSKMDYDEVDCSGDNGTLSPRLRHLLQKMQTDITAVIFFSVDDLEVSQVVHDLQDNFI